MRFIVICCLFWDYKSCTMKCPNCNEILLIAERNRVEIDYCPNCRGIWLDKGELDKLLDYAANHNNFPQSQQTVDRNQTIDQREDKYYRKDEDHWQGQHRDDYGKQRYPKKKKSFLYEFFDFD